MVYSKSHCVACCVVIKKRCGICAPRALLWPFCILRRALHSSSPMAPTSPTLPLPSPHTPQPLGAVWCSHQLISSTSAPASHAGHSAPGTPTPPVSPSPLPKKISSPPWMEQRIGEISITHPSAASYREVAQADGVAAACQDEDYCTPCCRNSCQLPGIPGRAGRQLRGPCLQPHG
jgi:hypothetical protein